MSDALHGIESDVPFDNAAADSLIAACNNAASIIESQVGSRATWVSTAMKDFKGHFANLFQQNATTAKQDATELAGALRDVSRLAGRLKAKAAAEQKRRETARQWKHDHDNRGFGGWVHDHLFGEDKPPVGPADPPLHLPAQTPPSRHRDTPPPGSGGGGGGTTTSARPADLHSFARQSQGANNELTPRAGTCKSDYSTFQARCRWGTLDAAGVFSAFDKWLSANANDVTWANTVGDAFAKAGGEGNVSTLSNSAVDAALKGAHVKEARQDLAITMPTAMGHPPTTGYAVDPVNTATGNFIETEVDLEFTEASSELSWTRSYNSVFRGGGAFGPGWSSWADVGLVLDEESASFVMPDGRHVVFPRLGEGWDRATGESLWLSRVDDAPTGDLIVSGNDGATWRFTSAGRLVEKQAGPGSAVRLTWRQGRLVALTHERGRSLTVNWAGGRVDSVIASDGRSISFGYDDEGRLVSATGPLGTRRYDWNESGLVGRVTDADGVVEAENVYDEFGRVTRQRSAFGRDVRFAYLDGRVTVVSDEDGSRSNTWIADQRGRLVGVVDSDERRQSMSYDAHGNVVMVTARDGGTAINEYDDRGRRIRQVTPSGADILTSYDEADRVVRVEVVSSDPTVDPEPGQTSVTTYTYEGDERGPATITDPEGGLTRMEWLEGLLKKVVDPTGIVVRFEHDEHGELVATTDAEGNSARLERDAAGRVVAAITPSGARTEFGYDEVSGLLARRTDPDGATWDHRHTTAGRPTVFTDPTGGRVEVEYGEHGEESRTVDPLGRSISRCYDELGNVTRVELPDGSAWQFGYDGLSRLRRSVDPAGGERTTDYDAVGMPVAATDPTGVRSELSSVRSGLSSSVSDGAATSTAEVDRLGRLVAETQPDGTSRLTRYDRCGRPVEMIDPIGGLTTLVRDAAGRVVTVVRPTGAELFYAYDARGHLASVTDETGAVTTFEYDVDSRLVARVLPTGERATTRYDECGRVVAIRTPGVGTATYSYDPAGRVVETLDPSQGRRRFAYDAAGQLVRAINANGGVTEYSYDANGRCTSITQPDGGVIRRDYDANNKVVAETDPLGRTTRAGYDAAGRQTWQLDPAGHRTEWRYDDQGRLESTWIDGVEQSRIERDIARRRVTITDRAGSETGLVTHELEWDARGLLVSRTREGRGLRWSYDANGACVAMTGPDGQRTDYTRDAAGRLVAVDHPLLGRAVIERDAAGRTLRATAGGREQVWDYVDGFVASHELREDGRRQVTRIGRDEDGRVALLEVDGTATRFAYDDALQLISAATRTGAGEETLRWRYDTSGRLVAESLDGATRELAYDAAGQLLSSSVHGEHVVTYHYDQLGRRTGEEYADGATRSFDWSATGWLAAVSQTDRLGDTRRTDVVVDALGELAGVDGHEMFFDTANPWGGLVRANDQQVVQAGPFTGLAGGDDVDGWSAPGWREARATSPDPWSLPVATGAAPAAAASSAGFEVSPTGELLVAGLEWMGNRVYDQATRGFLSVDPLDPVTGAGWGGNPYSFAGNDPLHALDPLGLRPATDADLQAYANAHQGAIHAAGQWLKNNWEYVAGGAMVVAGGVLIATGVGGPAGLMLVSAGADTIIQKATTGHVNWGEVAISGALGAVGGPGAGMAERAGLAGWKAAAAAGAVDGTWQGAAAGGGGYLTGPGPHTVGGFFETAGMGAVTGGVGGAGTGALTHGLTRLPGRNLGDLAPAPERPALPQAPERLALPPGPSATRPDFIVGSNGTALPTSRARLESGFQGAGFPSTPTRSPGMDYQLPDGSHVRIMEPSGQAPLRASFENAHGQPVDAFTGKQVQPEPGMSRAEARAERIARTHVELGP